MYSNKNIREIICKNIIDIVIKYCNYNIITDYN